MTTYAYETPRLWLQKMTVEEHLEGFHKLWNRPESLVWSSQDVKETLEEARLWMLTTLPTEEDPDIDKYVILLKPVSENPQPWTDAMGKPTMIGLTGTNRWSDEGMETGYCVNPDYWGKGYAGEAFRGFLEMFWRSDETKGFTQLVAKVDPGNVASQKIVIRAGAAKGGVLKEHYSRFVDKGVKRDLDFWWFDRPGASEDEMKEWKEEIKSQMVRKRKLQKAKEEREKAGQETKEEEARKE